MEPAGAAEPFVHGQRLTYQRPGLVEWYEANDQGIEHAFSIEERPAGPGHLVLDLALEGDLSAEISPGGVAVDGPDGAPLLRYDHLAVEDADGSPLRAWFEPSQAGVRIVVIDDGARYPLAVEIR